MDETARERADYAETCEELCRRILALIPDHPEILEFSSPWDLLRIPGFRCDDLQPSIVQTGAALRRACEIHSDGPGID